LLSILGGLIALLVRAELWTPGPTIISARSIQPGVHAARRDHDLPVHHPEHPGGDRQLRPADDARGQGRGVPAAEPGELVLWVVGAVFFVLAMHAVGGVDTGWTFYTPYSHETNTLGHPGSRCVHPRLQLDLHGPELHRDDPQAAAAGHGLVRMPLFCSGRSTRRAIIQVLATPVIGITLLLLAVERVFQVGIFDPASAATRCSTSTSSGSTRTRPSTS
jgi:cytochrome c oxidase subunit 1